MRRSLPTLSEGKTSGFAVCNGCGKCCKNAPGMYVPADFGDSVDRMADAIRRGVAQVDKWDDEGDALGEVYYLRPPTQFAVGEVFDFSWGGACALLRENGCSLPYSERPRVCRGTVPNAWGTVCEELGMTKRDYVERWESISGQVLSMATALEAEK